jgi:hypothetical protein
VPVAPRPVVTTPGRRDFAFAAFLALVLGFGVLGVLLLNTSMQQQAHRLEIQHDKLADLSVQAQSLRADLDWAADPHRLEALARELRLQPAKKVRYVDPATSRGDSANRQRRAATRVHAG